MPRVNYVKKAAKDYPNAGIEKGQPYYWWKFRRGPKIRSKTHPRRSQLTQSAFLSQLYDLEDGIDERIRAHADEDGKFDRDDVEGELRDIASDIEAMKDEVDESLENMPEHLRDSSWSGELLTERSEQLDEWRSELESMDVDEDAGIDDVVEQAMGANPGIG